MDCSYSDSSLPVCVFEAYVDNTTDEDINVSPYIINIHNMLIIMNHII
jgi:uncharacterized protein (DUF608 family)